MADTTDPKNLPAGEDTQALESGEDLAAQALAAADDVQLPASLGDEEMESDKLAETLSHLQNILERYATELETVNNSIKEKRESMRSVFENDSTLAEKTEEAQKFTKEAKERKAQLQGDQTVIAIKNSIAELSEQKKEIEETISNHLLNYYKITNSKSFDTSDGDQWDFDIRAKVKPRRKS